MVLAEGEIEVEIEEKGHRPEIGEEVFISANASHTVRNIGSKGNVWYYGYKKGWAPKKAGESINLHISIITSLSWLSSSFLSQFTVKRFLKKCLFLQLMLPWYLTIELQFFHSKCSLVAIRINAKLPFGLQICNQNISGLLFFTAVNCSYYAIIIHFNRCHSKCNLVAIVTIS